MESAQVWQVSTSVGTEQDAESLALGAVGAHLAACAHVNGPVTSVFHWEGELRTEPEWTVVLKSTAARFPALESYLRTAHPYEVPEILAVPVVAGSVEYSAWVRAEVVPVTVS
jgi:periplasmic divalent cation tolerance protein